MPESPLITDPDSRLSDFNPFNALVENAALVHAWAAAEAAAEAEQSDCGGSSAPKRGGSERLGDMLDLRGLLRQFRDLENVETPQAFFCTKVPAVGPQAYLNIIYKPAADEVRDEITTELRLPPCIETFLRVYNGARLFLDDLSIYGCLPQTHSLNRADPLAIPPFGIREANSEFRKQLAPDEILVGSYGYDRSLVYVNRWSRRVICGEGKNLRKSRGEWESFEAWLNAEVLRLATLFDASGNRTVGEEFSLPGTEGRA